MSFTRAYKQQLKAAFFPAKFPKDEENYFCIFIHSEREREKFNEFFFSKFAFLRVRNAVVKMNILIHYQLQELEAKITFLCVAYLRAGET